MEHRTSSEFQKAQRHSCDSIKGSPSPARTPASQQRMHSLTRRRTCKHSSSQAEATAQRKNPKNQANPKRGSSPPRHQSTVEMTRHGEGKGATLGPPSRLDGGGRNPRRPSEQQHQRRRRRHQQQPSSRSSPRDKPCPPFSPEPATTSVALSTASENSLSPEAFLSSSSTSSSSYAFPLFSFATRWRRRGTARRDGEREGVE